ncbi:MAG TPA: hypothetical protein VH394_17300 [Thermoanaerobaculia bacterium]|jgi:hypothetical protein|nr:hypothetical protein [Thermoanaerobaculia bacterium]
MKTVLSRRAWLLLLVFLGCADEPASTSDAEAALARALAPPESVTNPGKLVHVLVALCDNRYQGIVPVPERIGNGDDPANNLYWGAAFGVKTFFKKSPDWTLVSTTRKPGPAILERCVFKHRSKSVYLIADAYRGREIRQTTIDFLQFAAGRDVEEIELPSGPKLNAGGAADLIAYVGHDGLMDFSVTAPSGTGSADRSAIILACASKPYFADLLRRTGARPLLWTTNLMAPEAYVLKSALDGWIAGEDGEAVRKRAAEAYNRYQKCGLSSANRLFATGW